MNDKNIKYAEKENYTGAFSRLTFFPFLRFDNYNTGNSFIEKFKPGVFVTTNDMLNRYCYFCWCFIKCQNGKRFIFYF